MAAAKANRRRKTALFEGQPPASDLVAIRVMRLADVLLTRMTELLAPFGITPLQYNVLRILYVRDEEHEGLPIGAIGQALVTNAPDVSRLIDRLEKGGYIERVRKADDRRVVRVRLTDDGFAMVEKIHAPLLAHHEKIVAGVSKADLERLARDLERVYEHVRK